MEYTVINQEIDVNELNISFVANSSVIMVGDVKMIALSSAFETPPEKVIVGVTLPIVE